MMTKIIIFSNMIISMTLTMMKSPLSSNLIILTQAILLTSMINLIMKTSWMSFMIFILYIGGLMIIFLYISSIAFNELNIIKNYKNMFIKLIMMTILISLMKNFNLMENFKFENNFMFEDNFYLMNMFNLPNNLIIYFMLLILFFMLILITWMLKNNKGPIRQKI